MTSMRYRFLFWCCFFLTVCKAQAQEKKIDSLKTALSVHKEKDTTRVNLLYDLAYSHFQRDLDLTYSYLDEAERLSSELDYIKGKARVFYLKGILENIKSDYDKSLEYFEQSLAYNKSIDDQDGIASCYTAFGITFYDLSRYADAIDAYSKALDIYKKTGNKRQQITILINSANAYSEMGRLDEAVLNYKRALKESRAMNDEDGISYVHINLGVVYKLQGNYPLALDNFSKSLEYDIKTRDTMGMAVKMNNLGEVYSALEKYPKALSYYEKSLLFSSKQGNDKLAAIVRGNMGKLYFLQKNYNKALAYHNSSLKTSEEIGDLKQTAICHNNIGGIHLLLGKPVIARDNFEKAKTISEQTNNKHVLPVSLLGIAESYTKELNYQKALTFAQEAEQIAEELHLLEMQKKALELLSVIHENTGQFKKALEKHQRFKMLNDSLFNKENIEKIAQVEYEYKYRQARDSANIRELELTKQVLATSQDLARSNQNLLWATIGILLISILLGSLVFYQKFKNIKAKNETILTEQKLLRSQMNPHFVFNSLSVLQGMILNKEENKSVEYLSKFSKLLRLTLENSRDKLVLLSQEIAAVENYVALQNLESNQYEFSIEMELNDSASSIKIPPMLIQPFIENAIEHAFTGETQDRKIEVHLQFINEELVCTIKDNGIGINSEKVNQHNGKKSLATQITSERLEILSRHFKTKGSVQVENRAKYNEKGTVVTLVLPYEKQKTV
ncbi:tetratricopeptide repeat protein [Leeuwenhoekiella parthenopeia]|uniref:Tetratricopeptide repeat protein n=1 Tax=Leeuwenhoekiella parthenopeia TaxID=2890320 RepID=A0ABS8GXW7_9FLAO|nr:tetratricopeptide repeat protein [Leeuwenhoekiella parthenopeia]MCC4213946.1 tetratricopeptide repeat protein [Leeuwenhoekiella parthenopeia]